MKKFLFFIVAISLGNLNAQILTRSNNTLVVANGFELPNAWAGGFNAPQFSTIDVNADGLKDIFTFDRIGSRISIFLNTGTINGQTFFEYTREYNNAFPAGLMNWVLLRDFNCDGKEDIFANSQSQIKCWKNVSVGSNLAFEPVNNGSPIQADYDFGNPFSAPIYTVSVDIPAIEDYDGDGDLDIFTFTEQATTIYFFKSLQAENGNCETMDYICGNRCYGMFGESPESFSMILGSDFICGLNVTDPRSNEMLHTGGTLCSIDLDNNGLNDLVVGDVTETNLGALFMENAWDGLDSVVAFQNDFPMQQGAAVQVNLPLFPAAYYEDVNSDGVRDLIAAPNSYSAMDDRNSVWYFKNNGANAGPQFEFQMTNFLQNEM
ncbi:MAG: FG-GAP repeat domain-containing protein, partial [Bacteroidota bacterium]